MSAPEALLGSAVGTVLTAAYRASADAAPANGDPDHVGRSFSPLGLRGILVLDHGNGISGFAKSNQHSLGEMDTFFVTFCVPRRAVPRNGMINESGFDGACYNDKGVF
jgi:hypothetical protein